jgi:hypothetical protein
MDSKRTLSATHLIAPRDQGAIISVGHVPKGYSSISPGFVNYQTEADYD